MVPLSYFMKYVRPEVPGCPEMQIRDAIRQAGIDFCKQTRALRQAFVLTTAPGTAHYDLSNVIDVKTEPEQVMYIKRDQFYELEPSSELDFQMRNLDGTGAPGTPSYYYLDGREIVLGHTPSGVETLNVLMRIRPSEDAVELSDLLGTRYHEAIAYGAKAKLMIMVNQPWSNPAAAGTYLELFKAAVADDNLRYAMGATRKPLRTRARFF